MLHSADTKSMDRFLKVSPVWSGLKRADQAVGLKPFTILHAGPPISTLADVCTPIVNSTKVALVFEGWAKDFDEADRLIASGKITFRAAQDFRVTTPLAAVVSSSMVLQQITDANDTSRVFYAPFSNGMGWAMRYGQCSPELVEKIRWLNGYFALALQTSFDTDIPILPIAAHGLENGDDLHGVCTNATSMLADILCDRLESNDGADETITFLTQSPPFFLNIWMASCKAIISAAEGTPGSSLVTAMGGNGKEFGIQVAAMPGRWLTCGGTPPQGVLKNGTNSGDSLNAIGDSAVVEATGFGAMTWYHYSEAVRDGFDDYLPENGEALSQLLLADKHTAFPGDIEPNVGLLARNIRAGVSPIVSLGIVAKNGVDGLLGRGIWQAPIEPFVEACNILEEGEVSL